MSAARLVAVVTGTRAEFGLLRPVIHAIDTHAALETAVFVTGTHLLPPARTIDEVAAAHEIAGMIEMQRPGETGRVADATAVGRGVTGFAAAFADRGPDVVLVLGDRIEAFAAAAAASVAGIHLAHLHGGDRAEGVADDALRHAITKLAHVHLPATATSAARITAMGESPERIHVVGSPAIDGLAEIAPLDEPTFTSLGRPRTVFLLHPTGESPDTERRRADILLEACREHGPVLALHPNFDAGREGILEALDAASAGPDVRVCPHLDRVTFVGLLRRATLVVGNSSAGLIECSALPVPVVDVGARQAGREAGSRVVRCPDWAPDRLAAAVRRAASRPPEAGDHPFGHPFGDGHTGPRVAEVLARVNADNHPIRKRITY